MSLKDEKPLFLSYPVAALRPVFEQLRLGSPFLGAHYPSNGQTPHSSLSKLLTCKWAHFATNLVNLLNYLYSWLLLFAY